VAKLLEQLPRTSEEELRQRKERKWVAYDVLARIPEQIREEADSMPGLDEKRKALMMRDALIMAWLTTLPWRQRNLRECRVMPFADGGNLFQEEIPPHSTMSKPQWVRDALRDNPRQRFWQFYFRGPETKTGCVVRAILPEQLVPILEAYLERHRGILLGGRRDPFTLLLTIKGNPLTSIAFDDVVWSATLKYADRAVNPHLIRDIFTVQWLEEHPEDFLTASKNLWHRNIQTTLQIYGANFDESHAARRVEEC
jgi:hypothetical protein